MGDHLPPEIRISMNDLDDVERRMDKSQEELETIEISIESARLESLDDGTTMDTAGACGLATDASKDVHESMERSILFQQDPTLRTRIGLLSYTLDTLASTIDSVESHSDEEVKKRKKALSNKIVEMMNELDRMISTLR